MKQKLPGRNFLYKNLNLGETRRTQILPNSWMKCSLIGSLIVIFYKRLTNSFDFQIVTSLLPPNLRNSGNNKNFVANTLILFALSALIYCSGSTVGRRNLGLTKIEEQTRRVKDFVGIYRKSSEDLDVKFDILLHDSSGMGKKLRGGYFFHNSNSRENSKRGDLQWYESTILEEIISNYDIYRESLSKIIEVLPDNENMDELKHFFEFYINHGTTQNHNWEYCFNSVFCDRFTKNGMNYDLNNSSSFDILSAFCNKLLFKVDSSLGRKKYNPNIGLNFSEEFSNFFSMRKTDRVWWKREIFRNLRNWGEPDEFLVKSSLLLRKKGNLYLSNYMKFYLWQLLRNPLRSLKERQIFAERTYKYSCDGPNNPELFTTLENILSDFTYQFSRYLSHEMVKSGGQIMNTTFPKEGLNNNLGFINPDYAYMNERAEKYRKSEFIDFVGSDNPPDPNKYGFKCIKRNLYVGPAPVLIHPTLLNQFSLFLEEKPKFISDYLGKSPTSGEYIISNLFLQRGRNKGGIRNIPKSICYAFLELLSIDGFGRDDVLGGDFEKILRSAGRTNDLNNYIESNDIGITNLWRIRKYHPNFLWNYSFPFNPAYNTIWRNLGGRIPRTFWKSRLFLRIFHSFPPIFSKWKKLNACVTCIKLGRDSAKRNDELDVLIDKSNKVDDVSFSEEVLLLDQAGGSTNSNSKNKSMNDYFFIQVKTIGNNCKFIEDLIRIGISNFRNSVRNNCNTYFSRLLNDLYSGKVSPRRNYTGKSVIHGYSMIWEKIVRKSVIHNIKNVTYDEIAFQIYGWVGKISNLKILCFSKNFFSRKLGIKLPGISEIFPENFDSKYISRVLNSSLISTNIRSIYFGRGPLFEKSGRSIDQNSIANPRFDESINDSINGLFTDGIGYKFPIVDKSIEISPNLMKNSELFPVSNYRTNFSNSVNYSRNFRGSKQFFLHPEGADTKNYGVIYSQFLRNLPKRNEIIPTISEAGFSFIRERIVPFVHSQLSNVSLSKITAHKNLDKTNFSFFPDSYGKLSSRENFHLSNTSNAIGKNYSGDIPAPQLNNTKIKTNYNMLCSESLVRSGKENNETFQSISKILHHSELKYFKARDSEYGIGSEILRSTGKLCIYNRSQSFDFFARYISFKNYTSWFFTLEWWEYHIHVFIETFQELFSVTGYYLKYFIGGNIQIIRKNFKSLWEINPHDLNSKWNSRIFVDYEAMPNFLWSDLQPGWNNSLHWAVIILVASISSFYGNCLAIPIGSDSMDLWKHFETIKYLTDTSRAFYFTKSMHRSETRSNKAGNVIIHFFRSLAHHTRNVRFYLLTKRSLKGWLSNKSLDLSRRKRNLLIQSLITHGRMREYGFQSYPRQRLLNNEFGYQVTHQQGLLYLRYLAEILKKKLVNYPLHLADKWVLFASLQKIISSRWQAKDFDPKFPKIPVPLRFGLSRSGGILLIGPAETGRSYLIKNLAADSYVPLLGISISKLLYNKPDVITESWTNILIESLRRLNLTSDLARRMSPCIIWIQNIHQLNVNHSTQNVESDPTFLLGILSRHFRNGSAKARTKNDIIVIGSTHVPKRVDPALISPNRLDRIINIRLFNNFQRKNQFSILLNRKNLQLRKNLLHFNEFGSRTIGYNIRDLAALTDEVSLISVTRNESLIRTDAIKLALHRQIFGFTHMNGKLNSQRILRNLLHKIGRSVIQNILIRDSATNPLNICNYLWKKKFYYLSKWYSEPPIDESIIKESTILTHVLGCLAGIAARDSWFLLEKDSDTAIPIDKLVENDFDLASSILGSLSAEFPWLETRKTRFVNYKEEGIGMFPTRNSLNIMQNGIFAVAGRSITQNNFRYESSVSRRKILGEGNSKSRNTAWSPRFWRLGFLRSHLFDWIKRPNDFEFSHNSRFSRECFSTNSGENHYGQLIGKKKEQLLYERILPRVRRRNVQELEFQFEQILLEEQSEILGFFCLSTQYRMEYQSDNKPRLFIGKRILRDPIGLFLRTRHFVFSRREFFVDEEMLRRLYVTYGARRERERSRSSHKIKRFFLCRGYNKELINELSIRNQSSMNKEQNIDTLKRIEQIGIQLKRPQVFTPVYLYQRWLIENPPEKFPRFELLTHQQRWLRITNSSLNDSFTYTTLLESYQYSLRFFLSNRILLNRMTKILLRKGWLFQNEIEYIIHDTKEF